MSELLSISEFARRAGCDEKQVRRSLAKGYLQKGSDGLLDAVQLARSWRRQNSRTRRVSEQVSEKVSEKARTSAPTVRKGSDTSPTADAIRDARIDASTVGTWSGMVEMGLELPALAAEIAPRHGLPDAAVQGFYAEMRTAMRAFVIKVAEEEEWTDEQLVAFYCDDCNRAAGFLPVDDCRRPGETEEERVERVVLAPAGLSSSPAAPAR